MKTQDFYGTSRSAWRRALARIAATGAVAALAACQTPVAHERPTAMVLGRVTVNAADGAPILVVAFDRATGKVAHRAFLESQRAFAMRLYSGTYKFYACADENRDGHCGSAERRSVMYSLANAVHAGEVIQLPSFRLDAPARVTAAR
jgi:hypothetical protein